MIRQAIEESQREENQRIERQKTLQAKESEEIKAAAEISKQEIVKETTQEP